MLARLLVTACLVLPSVGCLANSYSSDPNKRILTLINQSEDLRKIELEVERFWMIDQPSHLTPDRVHGGVGTADGPATPPAPVSLAVANVRKEPVSLFSVHEGELRFLQKVAPGEAVDLPVSVNAKLAATFASAPHCANYTVKETAGQVWLLRPRPAAPETRPAMYGRAGTEQEADPNRRIMALINTGEDLRQIELEVERFWMSEPSHLTPERVGTAN